MEDKQPVALLELPVEILVSIWSHLPNRDIKSLRLTCSLFRDTAALRLERIFLSANPRNIGVFRDVATHDVYRRQIKEVIYDDARLDDYTFDEITQLLRARGIRFNLPPGQERCPPSFVKACRVNLEDLGSRKGDDVDRPDHHRRARELAAAMTPNDCWQVYQDLRRQQAEVIQTGSDIKCLREALTENWFPALQRITITPAAHGVLFTPLYDTPMIRALPTGFIYPVPRGWPVFVQQTIHMPAWGEEEEKSKDRWRGFRIITDLLANVPNHSVSEFVIDVSQLLTGLNCTIFTQPCAEYDNLATLLQQPNFERLDLALMVGGQGHEAWSSLLNGHLRRALTGAADLKHVNLRTDNIEIDPDAMAGILNEPDRHYVPLRRVFPAEQWLCLSHFGLGRFIVKQSDLISVLDALPALRSVEFVCLMFLEGDHWGMLEEMRDGLGWRHRALEARVRISIALESQGDPVERKVWIDREVHDFMYGAGRNPFCEEDGAQDLVDAGIGIVRDSFEPAHERPNLMPWDLVRAGYCKSEWLEEKIKEGVISAELEYPPTYML